MGLVLGFAWIDAFGIYVYVVGETVTGVETDDFLSL